MSTMVVNRPASLGGGLRRAWVGYQRLLDAEMKASGFGDRRFPDGRVLHICARAGQTTASQIARELGITRQGAAKLVSSLHQRGYLDLAPSQRDAREKTITLTPRARDYLATQRRSARAIERRLRRQIGDAAFDGLRLLLDALGGDEQPRMSDYLRGASHGPEGLGWS